MKRKLSLVTTMLLATFANGANHISLQEVVSNLDNPNYLFIDARDDSFYNGFKENGAKRGGHIKGAIQLSTTSLEFIEPSKFDTYLQSKGITKDKTLIVYDSDEDSLEQISAELKAKDYKVKTFKHIVEYSNDNKNPLEHFKNYSLSVSAKWLDEARKSQNGANKKPQSYDGREIMLFEVSWGVVEKSKTYKTHIKGAYHFNTDWIENAPVWNLSDPKTIEANLLKNGITKDKLIVLYSQNQMAALRVLWALKWAGVEDVRFLNGGMYSWMVANLPTETKVNTPNVEKNFGIKIPANPTINISMPQEAIERQKNGLKLVSNRAWDEYIGKISGYTYIKGKGEPKGAIWGLAGTDSSNMADYYDPDGTLRNPNEIFELWKKQGISSSDEVAFYCGTGWRGAVSWFLTKLAGWEKSYLYDGGWNAWQMDKTLPTQKGAPKGAVKIDNANDFGKVIKPGASCKS